MAVDLNTTSCSSTTLSSYQDRKDEKFSDSEMSQTTSRSSTTLSSYQDRKDEKFPSSEMSQTSSKTQAVAERSMLQQLEKEKEGRKKNSGSTYSLSEREMALLRTNQTEVEQADIQSLANRINWNFSIFYHGTTRESGKSIRENGMRVRLKGKGATGVLANQVKLTESEIDNDAKGYNYLTSEIEIALWYAAFQKFKAHKNPDLLRMLLPATAINDQFLEKDPRSDEGAISYRTQKSIRRVYVLPDDHSKLGKVLQKALPSYSREEDLQKIDLQKEEVEEQMEDMKEQAERYKREREND